MKINRMDIVHRAKVLQSDLKGDWSYIIKKVDKDDGWCFNLLLHDKDTTIILLND